MKIKVGDYYLDQYKDTDIAQTFSASEIGNIGSRTGSLSNNMKFPLTSNNRLALGFPDDLNSTDRRAYSKVDAFLIDGSENIRGFLKYKIVSGNNNEIQCTFFSSNSSWITDVKGRVLKDLDLSRFNHTWDYNTIADRIESDPDEGYAYPLIEYGAFINKGGVIDTDDDQLFPSTFVHSILTQIYNDIGWTVEGSLFSDPLFKRTVIPFSDKDFLLSSMQISASETKLQPFTNVSIPIGSENKIELEVDGSSQFQPNEFGDYTVRAFIELTIDSNPGSVFVRLEKKNSLGTTEIVRYQSVGSYSISLELDNVDYEDISRYFVVEVYSFEPLIVANITGGSIEFKRKRQNIVSGSEIDLSGTLPSIKQTDFLKYIFFSFGVIPQTNNKNRSVSLDLFNDVKNNIDKAIDWSDKIDLSRKVTTDFTKVLKKYGSESEMAYINDDNDEFLAQYFNDENQVYGSGILTIDNEFIKDKKRYTPRRLLL